MPSIITNRLSSILLNKIYKLKYELCTLISIDIPFLFYYLIFVVVLPHAIFSFSAFFFATKKNLWKENLDFFKDEMIFALIEGRCYGIRYPQLLIQFFFLHSFINWMWYALNGRHYSTRVVNLIELWMEIDCTSRFTCFTHVCFSWVIYIFHRFRYTTEWFLFYLAFIWISKIL